MTLNENKDRNIGTTLFEIGRCHQNLENYPQALIILKKITSNL